MLYGDILVRHLNFSYTYQGVLPETNVWNNWKSDYRLEVETLKYPRVQEVSGQHSSIIVKIRQKKDYLDSRGVNHKKDKARSQQLALSVTRVTQSRLYSQKSMVGSVAWSQQLWGVLE